VWDTIRKIYDAPRFVLTKPSWACMGLGKLFPARESLVSEILAGDENTAKPFFTVEGGGDPTKLWLIRAWTQIAVSLPFHPSKLDRTLSLNVFCGFYFLW